jgi:hypothetical protein
MGNIANPSTTTNQHHEIENHTKPQSLNLATHLVPSHTTPDSTTTKQTKEAENQTKPQGLNYSLNQVRHCTTRLDDDITNMERYVFSRKPAITAIHKPHQPSKPLPMNNQTFSLPIAPPPPIPTNQTNTQTQNETPLDILSQPLCANISPKGPDFVTQTQLLSQSISLQTTQDSTTTKPKPNQSHKCPIF